MPPPLTVITTLTLERTPHRDTVLSQSDGFPTPLLERCKLIAEQFGQYGGRVPFALLNLPLGRTHHAVVQVATTHGETLGFRFLVMSSAEWRRGVDPFTLSDRFPPNWLERGTVSALDHQIHFATPRVQYALELLKANDSPVLLGAVQILLDGGRILHITDAAPTPDSFRAIWNLLPYPSRLEWHFATFAFSARLPVQALTMPVAPDPWPGGYLDADQTRDYPEGRYELALQIAIEQEQQDEFERLLHRRTSKETLRLALFILAGTMGLLLLMKFVF